MKAIIIGAGIGGLSTAVSLRRAGIEVGVFERAHDLGRLQVGGGLMLWHNSVRALQALALGGEVERAGAALESMEYRSSEGRLLSLWPLHDTARRLSAPTIGITRADLHNVLMNAAGEDVVNPAMACNGFVQDGKGVTARYDGRRQERGDMLVGADGIRSVIRGQLLGRAEPTPGGVLLPAGDCHRRRDSRAERGRASALGLRLALRLPSSRRGRTYWAAFYRRESRGQPDASVKRELLTAYSRWNGPCAALIEATPEAEITSLDIHRRRPVKRWGEGRVTLLGDAAHAMLPHVGQGAGQALEDAVVLARCLGDPVLIAQALRAYEARRVKRTAAFANTAYVLGLLGKLSSPLACAVRDELLAVALRTVGWRRHEREMAYTF